MQISRVQSRQTGLFCCQTRSHFSCGLCHDGVPGLNDYGADMEDRTLIFQGIEDLDSDGDGTSNIDEINYYLKHFIENLKKQPNE